MVFAVRNPHIPRYRTDNKSGTMQRFPEQGDESTSVDRMRRKLTDCLIPTQKAGAKRDIHHASAGMARKDRRASRKQAAPIDIGGRADCVDYESQTLSIGNLRWAGVDFGDQLSLGANRGRKCPKRSKTRRINVSSFIWKTPTNGLSGGAPVGQQP